MNIKTNTWLNSNPAGLYVYRKRQHHGNTTPAGVAQQMFIIHFYKHLMPPASILSLTSVNGKETAPSDNRASAPFNVAKACNIHEICKPAAKADGNKADSLPRLFGGNKANSKNAGGNKLIHRMIKQFELKKNT